MSTFYTALAHVENANPASTMSSSHGDIGAVPADVDAVRSVLLDGLRSMRGDFGGIDGGEPERGDGEVHEGVRGTQVLDGMISLLVGELEGAGEERGKLDGVSNEFLDGLERVDKKRLKKGMDCPVCGNDFLDGRLVLLR
jgi:hypothetical protein